MKSVNEMKRHLALVKAKISVYEGAINDLEDEISELVSEARTLYAQEDEWERKIKNEINKSDG